MRFNSWSNLAVFAAFTLCAFVSSAFSPSGGQSLPHIHIVTLPIDPAAEVLYAADEGFFKKAGLDVTIDLMPNGGATLAAVISKAADIGLSNIFSLTQAFARGAPITLIAGASLAVQDPSTTEVVVAKSSSFQTAKDLDGKTFAVDGLRTLSEFAVRAWMDKGGGNASTVKFVEMPFPQIAAAVAKHRVDAGFLVEPFLTQSKSTLTNLGNPNAAIGKQFFAGSYFTSASWAKEHPDLVKRFSAVLSETADWANKHPAQTAAILARYTKLDPTTLTSMNRVKYDAALTPEMLQPVIDVGYTYHTLDNDFPAKTMIYPK